MKGEIKPQGYIHLTQLYLDRLTTKKLVALFDNYKAAHEDVLMELQNENREFHEAIKMVIDHFCEMVDMQDWYDELGKGKKG